MGGTIWVESEQGIGSSFHFTMLQLWAPPDALPSAPPSEGGRSRQTSTDSAADRDLAFVAPDTPPATPQARTLAHRSRSTPLLDRPQVYVTGKYALNSRWP